MKPDPHNFKVSQTEWEDAVFVNASYFILTRRTGINQYHKETVQTFPMLVQLRNSKDEPHRFFMYAVTDKGRSVCLNGDKYPEHWRKLWYQYHKRERL